MQNTKIIALAADHAGYMLKHQIIDLLKTLNYEILDFGTNSAESVDYPDFAHPLAEAVETKKADFGISICGSGNGINITVNKHQSIRSALCWNKEIAELARLHNDANVCALPARFIDFETASEIVKIFLKTEFEGGRHQKRIEKIPLKEK
jgi:ribose 5-phosphate isomerase B